MSAVPTVLIVEDNDEIAGAFAALLEQEGYAVSTASDAGEALLSLRNGMAPDVIILDLRLPTLDGLAFRREQMAHPQLADIPVIVVSAAGLREEQEAAELGMPFF